MLNRGDSVADPLSMSGNEAGSACRYAPHTRDGAGEDVEGLAEELRIRRRLLDTVLLPVGAGWAGLPGVVAPSGLLLHGPDAALARPLVQAIAAAYDLRAASVDVLDLLADPGVSTPGEVAGALLRAAGPGPAVIELMGADRVTRRRYLGPEAALEEGPVGAELLAAGLVELRGDDPRHQPLIVAASEQPWEIDDDLLVRGALDRSIFVPPPDWGRRRRILADLLGEGEALDVVAATTDGWSVADVVGFAEGVAGTSTDDPAALLAEAANLTPTAEGWMSRAREMVDFASDRRRFDDLLGYLRRYRQS